MSGADIPAGWKDRPEYDLEDAVRLWACAFYGVPLEQPVKRLERIDYSREYRAARTDLEANLELQEEPSVVRVKKTAPSPRRWDTPGYGCDRGTYTYMVKEKRVRRYARGEDLAAYARKRGRPGVFGFEPEEPDRTEWPFEHDTGLLRAVRWVIRTYWEGAEPKEWPTKDNVLDDLKRRFPDLSENERQAMDLVTRHDDKRRKGR